MFKKKIFELPKFLRKVIKFAKALLNIKENEDDSQNYNSLFLTTWITLFGIPIVTLLFGPNVSYIWVFLTFGVLILSNIDKAISML